MPKGTLPKEFVSTREAGELIGKGAEQIQSALRNSTFPVGVAFYSGEEKKRGKWAYRIPRNEFYKVFRPDLLECRNEPA